MDVASNKTYFKGVIFIEYNTRKNIEKQKVERLGLEKLNKQGSLMKIIEYYNATNLTVQFLDSYKTIIKHKTWNEFKLGSIINPYFPSIYNVGMIGEKYPAKINNEHTKEYISWHSIFVRCYSEPSKKIRPTYKDIEICDEWKIYENFYEWIHLQSNVDYFLNEKGWNVDKDILVKHNKIYSPDTCVLIPGDINKLFTKREALRGKYPVGVHIDCNGRFIAQCQNPEIGRQIYLGRYSNPEDAFYAYKNYKEKLIQKIAKEEFDKNRITEKCFEAMMNYKVEITD